jgi:hypothetical protein
MPQMCESDVAKENDPDMFRRLIEKDFFPIWTEDGGRHPTYVSRIPPDDGDIAGAERRPILLLHEYDHLTTVCLEFAERLSRQDFACMSPSSLARRTALAAPVQ